MFPVLRVALRVEHTLAAAEHHDAVLGELMVLQLFAIGAGTIATWTLVLSTTASKRADLDVGLEYHKVIGGKITIEAEQLAMVLHVCDQAMFTSCGIVTHWTFEIL